MGSVCSLWGLTMPVDGLVFTDGALSPGHKSVVPTPRVGSAAAHSSVYTAGMWGEPACQVLVYGSSV